MLRESVAREVQEDREGVCPERGQMVAGAAGAWRTEGEGGGLLRRLAQDAPWLACWCHEPASAPSRPHHASRSRATDTIPTCS